MVWRPPVDDRFCQEVGKLIIWWGFLEVKFDNFIQRMAKVTGTPLKENFRKVLKIGQRFERFSKEAVLCFDAFPAIQSELLDIRTKMETYQLDRDMFAHGKIGLLWPSPNPCGPTLSITYRRNKADIHRLYVLEDVQALVRELTSLMDRFDGLTEENAFGRSAWSSQELSALRDFLSRSR